MIPRYNKYRSYVTCSCGQVLYSSIKGTHLKSTRHRYGRKIVQLLEAGATLKEVGNKLGITRERVRQIAAAMGVKSATERNKERTEHAALQRFFSRLSRTRLGRFLEAAVAHGFTNNQLVPTPEAKYAGEYYCDRVWVNGKLVVVRASWGHRNGSFVALKYPLSADMDYVAFELPDGRWMFLPPNSPNKHTMFAPYDVPVGGPGYTYTKRHDFRDGIEAWHLFKNTT